jgi:antitoxin (DNA-binding transcriptional repressor) of toxin-antitoxin stability system
MSLTLLEAQSRLSDLIHSLSPGEEVIITENNRTVAKLIAAPAEAPRSIPGRGKGTIIIHDDSNDAILEDFSEYID